MANCGWNDRWPILEFHKINWLDFSAEISIIEADTVSERDFACPPKRRKQDECDDEIVLRKPITHTDDYKYRIDLLDPPTESLGKR